MLPLTFVEIDVPVQHSLQEDYLHSYHEGSSYNGSPDRSTGVFVSGHRWQSMPVKAKTRAGSFRQAKLPDRQMSTDKEEILGVLSKGGVGSRRFSS